MIFSPTRLEDMKFRATLLNDIESFIAQGHEDLANEVEILSDLLKVRIDTHDYVREDAWLEIENKIKNKMYVQASN